MAAWRKEEVDVRLDIARRKEMRMRPRKLFAYYVEA